MIIQEDSSRRNASLAGQSQDQRVRSAIKSNVLDRSMDEDKYQEGAGQRKDTKYLRESCYHRLKCFAANPLAALMRK